MRFNKSLIKNNKSDDGKPEKKKPPSLGFWYSRIIAHRSRGGRILIVQLNQDIMFVVTRICSVGW